jgi:DNA polymerase-3 subunit gamma/tau
MGFDGDWPKLANTLNLGGIAKQLAQASELQGFDGEGFELCVPPAAKHLAERNFQDKLRAALQEHFGRPIRLSVKVGETGGNTARDRAVAAISGDAFVRDLVENFDATILDSSIKPTP